MEEEKEKEEEEKDKSEKGRSGRRCLRATKNAPVMPVKPNMREYKSVSERKSMYRRSTSVTKVDMTLPATNTKKRTKALSPNVRSMLGANKTTTAKFTAPIKKLVSKKLEVKSVQNFMWVKRVPGTTAN